MWVFIIIIIIGVIYIRNKYSKGHYYLCDTEVDSLYYILSCIDKSGLNYFAIGGTLLGVVRHGGLIPWDDDADIAILEKDESFLLNTDWSKWDLELIPSWIGYKLRKKNRSFPFVDIFVMNWNNENQRFEYKSEEVKNKWPEWITKDQLYPLTKGVFGNTRLWCPNKSIEFLERFYGDDVMTHYYEEYSHRNDRSRIKQKARLPYPVPVCI